MKHGVYFAVPQIHWSLGNFNIPCLEGNGQLLLNKSVELENIGNLHNVVQENL